MKKSMIKIILISALLVSWGCQKKQEDLNPITPAEIEGHIAFLSDDLLEGRAVGSQGLELAALYHESMFRSLGLEPAFGDSFRQPLVLHGSKPDRDASLEFFSDLIHIESDIFDEFVVRSQRQDCPEGVEGELVYCGYLIQAPERDWDDIKGADLKGKVLLVEVNEPGNHPDGIFDGEEMTYYGRWTYKFEKAAQLGATGILIIHNTKGAAYGWEVTRNSWSGESFFLPDVGSGLFFQGWINGKTAGNVLKAAGFDRNDLFTKAGQRDFEPVSLGLQVRVRQRPRFRTLESENIGAVLQGKHKDRNDRYVILSAHYDHLGRDPSLDGDQIYNGAVDNCAASAALLALARYYSQHPETLQVNLIFVAVTAEEKGLLGSDYFARHLPVSSSSVLANLNFEMTNVWGETEDVYAIGGKHSDLDEICREAAAKLDLKYIPERDTELGYFYRSDQLSFARAGIPAVWLHEGITSKGEDEDYVLRKVREYRRYRYHRPSDQMEADWDLKGTVQVACWAREVISLLSDSEVIPDFKDSSSFRRK